MFIEINEKTKQKYENEKNMAYVSVRYSNFNQNLAF